MESTPSPLLLRHLQQQWIQARIGPEQTVAIAYSGGRDSGVLLALAARLHPVKCLVALYVDHGVRPVAERSAERTLVERQCRSLGVSLEVTQAPSVPLASANTENATRSHRHAAFARFQDQNPDTVVMLAHHAQDQAETILMRLLQGRSWTGLSGMPARRPGFLRPFLSVWPEQLAKAAQELALEWWEDSTNAEVSYQRNALRHEILPKIVQRFPRALGALVEFGRAWSELSLPQQPDAAWSVSELSARVSLHQWKAWSPRHREAELLSLASGWTGGRLSRRSLEALVQEHPVERWTGRAGSLRLSVLRGMVTWELVAKVSSPQYFIRVNDGQGLELPFGRGTVRFVAEGTALPVIVRGEPVFLASGFSVVARSWWGRHPEIRAQVLPGGRSCAAFLVQGNKVRALWGPDGTLIWKESSRPHLNGGEIFVNLELRSAYER